MKSLISLSTVALALIVGMASATAQTRAKQNVKAAAASPEARLKMCQDMYKGHYRTQQDGFLFLHGYCLSNVAGWAAPGPQPSARYGARAPYFGEPVGGGGGQFYGSPR